MNILKPVKHQFLWGLLIVVVLGLMMRTCMDNSGMFAQYRVSKMSNNLGQVKYTLEKYGYMSSTSESGYWFIEEEYVTKQEADSVLAVRLKQEDDEENARFTRDGNLFK